MLLPLNASVRSDDAANRRQRGTKLQIRQLFLFTFSKLFSSLRSILHMFASLIVKTVKFTFKNTKLLWIRLKFATFCSTLGHWACISGPWRPLWKACAGRGKRTSETETRSFCYCTGRRGVSPSLAVTEWLTAHPGRVSLFPHRGSPSLTEGCDTMDVCTYGWIRHVKRWFPRWITREDARCDVDEKLCLNTEDEAGLHCSVSVAILHKCVVLYWSELHFA